MTPIVVTTSDPITEVNFNLSYHYAQEGDIDEDNIIGLPEVLYILQLLAE